MLVVVIMGWIDYSDLVLEHVVPCFTRKSNANQELEEIKREVSDNAVKPDYSSPFPSNSMDSCKFPVSIH